MLQRNALGRAGRRGTQNLLPAAGQLPALPSARCVSRVPWERSIRASPVLGRVMVRGRLCLVLAVRGCSSILPSRLDPVCEACLVD